MTTLPDKTVIIPPLKPDQRAYLDDVLKRSAAARQYDPTKVVGGPSAPDRSDPVQEEACLQEHELFYCFYCDDNSPRLICKRCGNTAQPSTPVKDAYYNSHAQLSCGGVLLPRAQSDRLYAALFGEVDD